MRDEGRRGWLGRKRENERADPFAGLGSVENRFGGVSAMVACVLCWRMMRAKERLMERGGG